MDSGSSGSMSSNGGHDDQDQPESVSGFLNPSSHSTLGFGGSSNLFPHYQTNTSPFDLSSNYLHALSLPNSTNQSFLNPNLHHQPSSFTNIRSDHHHQQQAGSSSSQSHRAPYGSAKTNNLVRNSKKRTRASRKAPTTVMTTDTSNFRAMVQEFTGIPAPPFFSSASSSSYSRRLEIIFGSTRSSSVYPLRPSAHKVHHQPPFLSSSSSSNSPNFLMSNSVGMISGSNVATSTSSPSHDMNNFSFTAHQGLMGKELPNYHTMMANMQNPILHHHDQHQEQPSLFQYSLVNNGAKTTLPSHYLFEDDLLGTRTMSHGYQSTSLDGSAMKNIDHQSDHHLMPNLDQGMVDSSRSNSRGGDEVNVESSWVGPSD